MTTYDDLSDIFEYFTVWSDDRTELYWYRWTWKRLAPSIDTDDPVNARIVAATLVYIYSELCFFVCDENFYEDAWDRLGECVDEDMGMELGFMCGQLNYEECPSDIDEALRLLVKDGHDQVVESLSAVDTMKLLTAFHASYASPQHLVTDEDGDEMEEDMIESYEDFCRYVDDDDFRDEDLGGMFVSDYEAAYGWWESGAEMLESRTASDEI